MIKKKPQKTKIREKNGKESVLFSFLKKTDGTLTKKVASPYKTHTKIRGSTFQNKRQSSIPSQVLGQLGSPSTPLKQGTRRVYILCMYLHSDCLLWAYWWRRRQKKTPQTPPHQIQAHHQNLQKKVTGEVSVPLQHTGLLHKRGVSA